MMVQAVDGRVHQLLNENLPDTIILHCGVPYSGAHLAEVLLSPKNAKGTRLLPAASGWVSMRDLYYAALGVFFYELIGLLAEGAALALS